LVLWVIGAGVFEVVGVCPIWFTAVAARVAAQAVEPWSSSSVLSAGGADLPVVAEHPARHLLVYLGWFQWAQAGGTHQDHLVVAPAAGFLHADMERFVFLLGGSGGELLFGPVGQ
jgi:hypothetical protein